jgi:hypothetical protein
MPHDKSPEFDHESYREFARKMKLFEEGPTTTHFEQLTARGIELPEPDSITEENINGKLWEVIRALAELRAYLDHTDHLSDRELYRRLWKSVLREEVPAIDEIGFFHHIDLSVPGDDDSELLYLRHYADEDTRRMWLAEWPDIVMPEHVDPPFDRDRLLPG